MNRLIPILITVILLFTNHYSLSQGIWKTYTAADGLAGNQVVCINQDKIGNYWIGTWGTGLCKLDTNGVWTNFLIGDSLVFILDIEIDSLNNKWLVYVQQGGTYYSGGTYIVKFDDSTFTYYDPTWSPYDTPRPTCLGQDSSGNIWCGTNDFYAYWFDGENWHEYGVWGCWGELCTIYEIKLDHYGRLYFGHYRGIASLGGYLRPVYWVHDIEVDRQNRLWFGSYDYYQPFGMFDGENWHAYTLQDGLRHSDVVALAVDSSNNIWLSYGDGFVSKFDGYTFTHIELPLTPGGAIYDHVWDIYVDDKGKIWFSSYSGILILTDTTTTKVNHENNKASNQPEFALMQNYPNPFNASTLFQYSLTVNGFIDLSIYNMLGEEVKTLIMDKQSAGWHNAIWNGTDKSGKEVSSGIYLAVLTFNESKKMIKLSLIR